MHPILYYCPSRTKTHLHVCTSAYCIIVCLSTVSSVEMHESCHAGRKRIRIQCTATHMQLILPGWSRIPQGSLKGPSRFALGLTTAVGIIQQGILDSVRRICRNTCLSPAQPVRPWSSPGDRVIPQHLSRAQTVARPSSVSSCSFRVHAREPTWQAVRESTYM